jgi:hypothetical protein
VEILILVPMVGLPSIGGGENRPETCRMSVADALSNHTLTGALR